MCLTACVDRLLFFLGWGNYVSACGFRVNGCVLKSFEVFVKAVARRLGERVEGLQVGLVRSVWSARFGGDTLKVSSEHMLTCRLIKSYHSPMVRRARKQDARDCLEI
ncbi:hypothetical protein QBC45DRAFT_417545 [Copromyces sp. CBS 386.78]|nr:hypothetical protein QBC45DRAFT_417545 [Copromyces sp. CBS 386.78]